MEEQPSETKGDAKVAAAAAQGSPWAAVLFTLLLMFVISKYTSRTKTNSRSKTDVNTKSKAAATSGAKRNTGTRPGIPVTIVATMNGLTLQEEIMVDGLASCKEVELQVRSELGIAESATLSVQLPSELTNGSSECPFPSGAQLRSYHGDVCINVTVTMSTQCKTAPVSEAVGEYSEQAPATASVSPKPCPNVAEGEGNVLPPQEESTDEANIASVNEDDTNKQSSSPFLKPVLSNPQVVEAQQNLQQCLLKLYAAGLASKKVTEHAAASAAASRPAEDGVVTEIQNSAHLQDIFSRAKSFNRLVVVDFYATWCGPCRRIAPRLVALSQSHAGKVWFVKVDVDRNRDIQGYFEIRAMPTFHFILNGQSVATVQGANESAIIQKVNELSPNPQSSTTPSSTPKVSPLSGLVVYGSPLSSKAAEVIARHNTQIDEFDSNAKLGLDDMVSIRLWMNNPQHVGKFTKALPVIVKVLGTGWPQNYSPPVLDALRSAVLDPGCATTFASSPDLRKSVLAHCVSLVALDTLGTAAEDSNVFRQLSTNTTLAMRLFCNFIATVGASGGASFHGVVKNEGIHFVNAVQRVIEACKFPKRCAPEDRRHWANVVDSMGGILNNLLLLAGCAKGSQNDPDVLHFTEVTSSLLAISAYAGVATSPFMAPNGEILPCLDELRSAYSSGGSNSMAVALVKVLPQHPELALWVNQHKEEFLALVQSDASQVVTSSSPTNETNEQGKARTKLLMAVKLCCQDPSARQRMADESKCPILNVCRFLSGSTDGVSHSARAQDLASEVVQTLRGKAHVDIDQATIRRTVAMANPWA